MAGHEGVGGGAEFGSVPWSHLVLFLALADGHPCHVTEEEPSAQTGEVTYFVIVLLGRIENLLSQPGLGATMLGSEI